MTMNKLLFFIASMAACACSAIAQPARDDAPPPQSSDPRIVIELFAEHPQIVTPTGLAVDRAGHVFVIESNTHFRPDNYKGPAADRILRMSDTTGDRKADKIDVFHEGTIATMDLALSDDGWLYVAERSRILRLRDTDNDGKADKSEDIVTLDTTGTYPHDGLSGLAFDFFGNLNFGFGENLGHPYKLIGKDGKTFSGEAEGGNTYRCNPDGTGLTHTATGFWNPFGMCVDSFGNVFAVDNDPGGSPPCRLLHIVDGGDYGYKFRYGRSGIHPFVAWFAELPGTLPMVAGTGDGPCEVLDYESDGLPAEYRGNLLSTSWADHRIERYRLTPKGASYTSTRETLIQGGQLFRPVSMDVAPDGSIFVSDWANKSYTLHGHGRVWRIRMKDAPKQIRSKRQLRSIHLTTDIESIDRTTRRKAAKALVAAGQLNPLNKLLRTSKDPRLQATALQALSLAPGAEKELIRAVEKGTHPEIQALAHRLLLKSGNTEFSAFAVAVPAPVDRQELANYQSTGVIDYLLDRSDDDDPFISRAAILGLRNVAADLLAFDWEKLKSPKQRIAVLLALKLSGGEAADKLATQFLHDADANVRFEALRWISDHSLKQFKRDVERQLYRRDLDFRYFHACLAALESLNEKKRQDSRDYKYVLERLKDESSPTSLRTMCLRLLRADDPKLSVKLLTDLLASGNASLQLEVARKLALHPAGGRKKLLIKIVNSNEFPREVRLEAVVGLAHYAKSESALLLRLATGTDADLQIEALRALRGAELPDVAHAQLRELSRSQPSLAETIVRIGAPPTSDNHPPSTDTQAWLTRLNSLPSKPDPAAGRRIFFHSKAGACFTCHQIEEQGTRVGPDLTRAWQMPREKILESILQPSKEVAPQYFPWEIEMSDGESHTGFALRKGGDRAETYLNAQGKEFRVAKSKIRSKREKTTSIMPDGLQVGLTDEELRDLLTFLTQRR